MSQMGKYYAKTPIETLTGDTGGPISPDTAGNINIVGSRTATFNADPLTNTITFNDASTAPEQFTTDSGVVIAVADNANVFGAHGVNTSGSGDTITIAVNNALTLGDIAPVVGDSLMLTTGNLNVTTGNIKLSNTVATGLGGVIQFNSDRFMHNYGTSNTFIGSSSGNFSTSGSELTALGKSALISVTSGDNNTAVGTFSQSVATSASDNTSLGSDTLLDLTTGDTNTALGSCALSSVITGDNNIGVGYNAGSSYNGAESNNIVIGNIGVAADVATVRIGTNAVHSSVYIAGIDGVDVGNVARVVTENNDKLGTAAITGGVGIVVTPTANTITIASSSTSAYTAVNTSPYVATASDSFMSIDCTAAAITVKLPDVPTAGRVYAVKDRLGGSAANNITITTVTGAILLDGAASFVMNTNYQAINIIGNGTNYELY